MGEATEGIQIKSKGHYTLECEGDSKEDVLGNRWEYTNGITYEIKVGNFEEVKLAGEHSQLLGVLTDVIVGGKFEALVGIKFEAIIGPKFEIHWGNAYEKRPKWLGLGGNDYEWNYVKQMVAKREVENEIDELKTKVEDQKDDITRLQQRIQSVRAEIYGDLDTVIKDVKTEVTGDYNGKFATMTTAIERCAADIGTLQANLKKLELAFKESMTLVVQESATQLKATADLILTRVQDSFVRVERSIVAISNSLTVKKA